MYQIGSGRSLDYDSSLTVGAFVKTHSLLDPLKRQIQLNNHPLFSILEHIVWSLGFHSETYLRCSRSCSVRSPSGSSRHGALGVGGSSG